MPASPQARLLTYCCDPGKSRGLHRADVGRGVKVIFRSAGLVSFMLAVVAVASCTSNSTPVIAVTGAPLAPPSTSAQPGLLTEVPRGAVFSVTVTSGDIRYDGLAVVTAAGGPVKVLDIATSPTDSVVMTVTKTGVVELGDTDSSGGLLDSPPSSFAPHLAIKDLADIVLQPGRRYALMLVLKADRPGRWSPQTVTVTYESNGQHRTLDVGHPVVICVDPIRTAEC